MTKVIEQVVVSLSGGVDSATALALALQGRRDPKAILAVSFMYGSKHGALEGTAATKVARYYGVTHWVLDLVGAFAFLSRNSSLMRDSGRPVPEGHYQEETMKSTVVPGRNMVFASVLAGVAWDRLGPDAAPDAVAQAWLGIHAGDHAIYPDCRPEFATAMMVAVAAGTDRKVELVAPFLYKDKAEIISLGLSLKVPYGLTRTCYTSGLTACGKCGSCIERREAFQKNGVEDPIAYASRDILPKKS
jgi:7-cyano-7-deazaguanine synthase